MKSKLTLGILLCALVLGSLSGEAHPIHSLRSGRHVAHSRQRGTTHRHAWHRSFHRFAWRRVVRAHGRHRLRLERARSGGLRQLVARLAAQNGVPYRLADAVVTIESRYNPRAAHGGALGLMQIKPQTARGLGFRGSARSLLDPGVNVQYGMRYLAIAYRQSRGNLCATVMRYQSGTAARHMTRANRAYCSRAHSLIERS